MRVRDRDNRDTPVAKYSRTAWGGAPGVSGPIVLGGKLLGTSQHIEDVVHPFWFDNLERGSKKRYYVSACNSSRQDCTCSSLNIKTNDTGGCPVYSLSGPVTAYAPANHPHTETLTSDEQSRVNELMDSVLIDAHAKMNSTVLQLGVSTREYRQTADMFTKPLEGLRRNLYQLFGPNALKKERMEVLSRPLPGKKKAWKRLARLAKAILRTAPRKVKSALWNTTSLASNCWLQYRYGLVPLMSDIAGLAKLYVGTSPVQDQQTEVYRCASDLTFQRPDVHGTFTVGGFIVNYTRRSKVTVKVSGGVICRLLRNPTWEEQAGVTGLDIPLFLWEITPYSFVEDWVFKVGKYLEAHKHKLGNAGLVQVLYTWSSAKVTYEHSYSGTIEITALDFYLGAIPYSWEIPVCTFNKTHYVREVNRELPGLPQAGTGVSTPVRALDAMALTQNILDQVNHLRKFMAKA